MPQSPLENTVSDAHTAFLPIDGRGVLVTGGTTGIGRAIARLLAVEGARVFIFGRHQLELDDALASIRDVGGDATGTVADVAKAADVERVFSEAEDQLGGIDVLVNNAGLGAEGVVDMAEAEWRYVVETNLVGYLACAQHVVPLMEARKSGHIVLIGSVSADRRGKDSSVYVATKAGIQGFAESLHKEVREKGIKVSLIEPGKVGADLHETSDAEQRRKINKGEMLRAEDIAVAVHYVLTQPARCDVTRLVIRPHAEAN